MSERLHSLLNRLRWRRRGCSFFSRGCIYFWIGSIVSITTALLFTASNCAKQLQINTSFMWLKPSTFWHSLHQPANELDKTQFIKTSIKLLYVSALTATLRESSATQDHKSNTLIHRLIAPSLRYYSSRLHGIDKEGTALMKRAAVWYTSSWVVLYCIECIH